MHAGRQVARGAARYSLAGRARLLLDVRVVGTAAEGQAAPLRAERPRAHHGLARHAGLVRRRASGSAPALARHGYVTITLNRALHAGRMRLVLIASDHVVIVGNGAHKPTMQAG